MQVVGVLNTVSGHFEYCAKVRKYLCHPKANLRAAAAPPKAYLLPSGRKAQVLATPDCRIHEMFNSK